MQMPIAAPPLSLPVSRLYKQGIIMNSAHHPSVEKLKSMISRVTRAQMTPTAISANPKVIFIVLFIRIVDCLEKQRYKITSVILSFFREWALSLPKIRSS